MDIFLNAAGKSSDILEVDVESLDDNILEGAGATLGTGELGSGRTHTHYPGSGQLRRWRLLTHLTMQLLSPVQHVQQQNCQLRVVRRDYILAAMVPVQESLLIRSEPCSRHWNVMRSLSHAALRSMIG